MKVYTEEEVIKAIKLAQEYEHWRGEFYFDYTETEVLGKLTPIEIPSDEEMRKMAKRICNGHQHAMRYNQMLICCFRMGKSVRDKIQGGNK